MAPIRTFSEDTVRLLNEMAQWYKGNSRRLRKSVYNPETDHQASQCYVAYAPEGIPALSNNIPGNEYCTIWEITDDVSGTTNPVLLQIGNSENTERVFNLSGTAIEANSWIPIIRDKFGRWLVAGGAGGTTTGGDTGGEGSNGLPLAGISFAANGSQAATFSTTTLNIFSGLGSGLVTHASGIFTFNTVSSVEVLVTWSFNIEVNNSGGNIFVDYRDSGTGRRSNLSGYVTLAQPSGAGNQIICMSASGIVTVSNLSTAKLEIAGISASVTNTSYQCGGITFIPLGVIT